MDNKFLISLTLYLTLFILPSLLYLKLIDKVDPISFLKLNTIKIGITKGIPIGALLISALIVKRLLLGGHPLSFNLGILWLSGLLVGILEEIPFRGFILQKLLGHLSFLYANLLTSVLFISIHLPIWLLNNANLVTSMKSAFIFSFILGYLFREYKSLWVPIIFHSTLNLCIWIGL